MEAPDRALSPRRRPSPSRAPRRGQHPVLHPPTARLGFHLPPPPRTRHRPRPLAPSPLPRPHKGLDTHPRTRAAPCLPGTSFDPGGVEACSHGVKQRGSERCETRGKRLPNLFRPEGPAESLSLPTPHHITRTLPPPVVVRASSPLSSPPTSPKRSTENRRGSEPPQRHPGHLQQDRGRLKARTPTRPARQDSPLASQTFYPQNAARVARTSVPPLPPPPPPSPEPRHNP